MKKLKILYTPSWEKANPYQRLLKEACEKEGCQISYANYPEGFFPFYKLVKHNPDIDVLHVHWISEILMRVVWSRASLLFWLKYILFGLDCWLVKRKKVKLIWTIHNKYAHENQHRKREVLIRKLLGKQADNVILHSDEALLEINKLYNVNFNNKASVIFHGNYQGCYPQPSANKHLLKEQFHIAHGERILLFFGALKPYKGIETLISAVQKAKAEGLKLIICGEPHSAAYQEELVRLIDANPQIITLFRFLEDQEMIDFINLADVVVLPFSDTLTSGSVILAMTQGKALILSEQAKVFGCVPEQGVKYFSSLRSLQEILITTEKSAYEQMGLCNLAAADLMSWEKVAEKTVNIYKY